MYGLHIIGVGRQEPEEGEQSSPELGPVVRNTYLGSAQIRYQPQ
jgi:hypothetical protein